MFLLSLYLRSTPVESLHTVLLGASKYMLRSFMDSRTTAEKKIIHTMVHSFPYCGLSCKITGNIRFYKSFVGRDFKAFMQMAMFIVTSFLSQSEIKCWFLLCKVHVHKTIILTVMFFLDFSGNLLSSIVNVKH